MKTILVTGGAGYIGSACARALLDAGHIVVVVDNLSHGDTKYVDERAKFVQADLRDAEAMDALFATHDFDIVMHFAAFKAVGESEANPMKYFENNVGGTMALLSHMAKHGVTEIVFSSSAAVYAPQDTDTYTEKDVLGPINVYGTCKVIEEQMIQELARTGVLHRYAILRYFNVAGDVGSQYVDNAPENVFPRLARAAAGVEPFHIYGVDYETRDGTGVRDYIHLEDLVDAHIRALEHGESGIWNLGTNTGTSVRELVQAFEFATKKPLNAKEVARRDGDPSTLLADASKAIHELGWQPKRTVDDMVKTTLHYLS